MKWITVQDLAKYLKLSTMMVYKLAQEGVLPAVKIGRVWRFEESQIDEWLKRQNISQTKLPFSPRVREIIEDFVRELRKEFKENLAQVIVFGSQARGDATEESDVDVLVVFKKLEDYWKISNRVGKLAYAMTFDKDRAVVLSTIVMEEGEFLTGGSPLLLNIRREGKRAA